MAEPMTQALERLSANLLNRAETVQAVAIQRGLLAGTAPAPALIRAEALATLPKAGGANQWVADAVTEILTRTGSRSAGVIVRTRKTGHDLRSIDQGKLRHPTFGQPKPVKWGMTPVKPGFFSRPMELKIRPAVTVNMRAAMVETARAING